MSKLLGCLCCFKAAPNNKILPSEVDLRSHTIAIDNFFLRGQGDGASDVEDFNTQRAPVKPERHVSGYSSTRTTLGDIESRAGVSDLESSDEDEDDDDTGTGRAALRSDIDERHTVVTEGGLSRVALELDHPFAPYFEGVDEGEIPNMLLSDARLRNAGFFMADRSTVHTRSMHSRLSGFTEMVEHIPKREATPVPGKRQPFMVHHLAKHRMCPVVRQYTGSTVVARHVPVGGSQPDSPHLNDTFRSITPLALTSHTPGRHAGDSVASTARTLPADDVDSLPSSDDNLSAIGEGSETSQSDSSTDSSSDSDDDDDVMSEVTKPNTRITNSRKVGSAVSHNSHSDSRSVNVSYRLSY